jgi:hypothetical protein
MYKFRGIFSLKLLKMSHKIAAKRTGQLERVKVDLALTFPRMLHTKSPAL